MELKGQVTISIEDFEKLKAAAEQKEYAENRLTAFKDRMSQFYEIEDTEFWKQVKEIDRETAKKLREKADEEKMQQLPSDGNKDKCIRMSQSAFEEIEAGKPYIITKDDSFRKGQEVTLIAFKEGKATGQQCKKTIICVDTSITSSALEDGYCILGLGEVKAGEE